MNSNSPTRIVGIYKYPEGKTLRRWQNQHRQMFTSDPSYRLHVYAGLAVWFFTCFAPLIYFALFPDKFLTLSGPVPTLLGFEFLIAGGMLLFLRRSLDRATKRHSAL